MGQSINWAPTTTSLHQIHHDLSGRYGEWPHPRIQATPIREEQRRRARLDWSNRVRATYVSAMHAASLHHQLLTLGAPLDVLSGAAYVSQELTQHLTATTHLLRPLQSETALEVPHHASMTLNEAVSWEGVFEHYVEFFGFNIALSIPLYDALAAVSSDKAIAQLSDALSKSLGELQTYGTSALQWMHSTLPERLTAPVISQLPGLLANYERLCDGGPEVLDELAGKEIVVETRPGNLGTLQSDHCAAIFYDTLNTSIFPLLDGFGWQSSQAWQRHYEHSDTTTSSSAVIMALGLLDPAS